MTSSPTHYKMEVKLLSEDKKVLAKLYKGPLQLPPNGQWRKVELTVNNYNLLLKYIEFTDSGSCEEDNTTKVARSTVQLGHIPGICAEAFSLPLRDSLPSRKRTCLLFVSLPHARTFFQKWKIECSQTDSESYKAPIEHVYSIGTYKTHRISLKIPTASMRIRIFAVGKHETQLKVGDILVPPAESKNYK